MNVAPTGVISDMLGNGGIKPLPQPPVHGLRESQQSVMVDLEQHRSGSRKGHVPAKRMEAVK